MALLLACALLYGAGLGGRPLWDTDEGMHAATSKAMIDSGDWITPTFNGEPFLDKPPLYNWLVAISFLIFGFTEFAARLPGATLGVGLILLTYAAGRRMIGHTSAMLGAIVLATSLQHFAISSVVVHDVCLSFFVGLALFAFYRAYSDDLQQRRYLLLAYVAVGLGVLAKGPLGVVLPVGAVTVFLLVQGQTYRMRDFMPVRGALISAAIALPWYILVSIENSDFVRTFLLEQNIGNFAGGEPRHAEPFYFYIPVLLVCFFPWSLLFPSMLGRWLRQRTEADQGIRFLLVWMLFVFVLFSVASSKLVPYMAPMLPAAALLLGEMWTRLCCVADPRLERNVRLTFATGIPLVALLVGVGWWKASGHPGLDSGRHLPMGVAYTVIVAALILVSTIALVRGRYRQLFASTAAGVVATLALFIGLISAADEFQSSKAVVRDLDRRLSPRQRLVFYREWLDSAMFYTDRQAIYTDTTYGLLYALSRPGAIALVEQDELNSEEWQLAIKSRVRVLERYANKLVIEGVDLQLETSTAVHSAVFANR